MSEFRVERLNALLHKVQENRKKPRPARAAASGGGTPDDRPRAEAVRPAAARAQAPQPVAVAAPSPLDAARAALASSDAGVRGHEGASEVGPRPAEDRAIRSSPPPRRPAVPDRRAAPLETSVAGELDRDHAEPAPHGLRVPAVPSEMRRDPAAARSMRPAEVAQPPIVPRVIEPDAPRESNRPIAQVVSKHAQPVDATFGAMLKRSLTLRPH